MKWGQLGVGFFLLFFSMLLRSWGKVNEKLPVYHRPLAFQNRRFTVFLSMVWQGLLFLGLLTVSLVEFWMGLAAAVICFFGLSPFMVYILEKVLGYDKLRMPPGRKD